MERNCSNITVEFHEVDASMLYGVKFSSGTHVTAAAYYRILLPTVLPLLSKVLWLDCDILVLKDISPLFNIDMTHYAVAAVEDILKLKDEHRLQLNLSYADSYFNSGVMMVNLDYWREHDVERRLLEFSKMERDVFFEDQDALNHVFRKQWFQLSPQWNRLYPAIYPKTNFRSFNDINTFENPKIIHFAGPLKPWYNIKWFSNRKFIRLYRFYLTKTDWETVKLKHYTGRTARRIVYRRLLKYDINRLFTYYMSAHYFYIKLKQLKHFLYETEVY